VEIAERIGYTVVQVSGFGGAMQTTAWRGCTIDRSRAGPDGERAQAAQIVALTLRPPGAG